MIYEWKCDHCACTVEVERTLDEYNVPPTKVEKANAGSLLIGGPCTWRKVFNSSTPFETLRDKGVLERLERHT